MVPLLAGPLTEAGARAEQSQAPSGDHALCQRPPRLCSWTSAREAFRVRYSRGLGASQSRVINSRMSLKQPTLIVLQFSSMVFPCC